MGISEDKDGWEGRGGVMGGMWRSCSSCVLGSWMMGYFDFSGLVFCPLRNENGRDGRMRNWRKWEMGNWVVQEASIVNVKVGKDHKAWKRHGKAGKPGTIGSRSREVRIKG